MKAAMRVHPGLRVRHVCNENADNDGLVFNRADMILERPIYGGLLAPDLPVGPIPYRIGTRHKRVMR